MNNEAFAQRDTDTEEPEPRVSATVAQLRKEVDVLGDRTDKLTSLLEPVMYGPMTPATPADPNPARSVPPLIGGLDDILRGLRVITRRIDDLGDRVAL